MPVLTATALASTRLPEIRLGLLAFTLLSCACLQIATNFINDVVDHDRGADGDDRLGPKRGLQKGVLSRRSLGVASGILFGLAIFFAAPLIYQGGYAYLGIGLVSIFFAWAYTGGPFPLAYNGLGDPFVLLFFGWVAVAGTYFLQTLNLADDVWLLGTQIGLLATVLIAINNLRDVKSDERAGKRTLPVRFGVTFGRVEISLLLLVPYVMNAWWWKFSVHAALLPYLSAPLAFWLARAIWREAPSERYNKFLAVAGLLHLLFGLLLSAGFLLRSPA